MPSPRDRVIVATYNRSTVLPYAIGNVLAQTMRDFELIVMVDGCRDDSEHVVTAIKDPRLRWIHPLANTGCQVGPKRPLLLLLEQWSRIPVFGPLFARGRALWVFGSVSFAWIFFKLPNLDHAMSLIGGMFANHSIGVSARIFRSQILIYALPVVLLQHMIPWPALEPSLRRLRPYLYGAMAALALVDAGADTAYIYFQF
jgi:hypothetical protein